MITRTESKADKYNAEHAVHQKVDRTEDEPLNGPEYIDKQSNVKLKCYACRGVAGLVKDCKICHGKGVLRSQAVNTTVVKRDDVTQDEHPLWFAFASYMQTPTLESKEKLVKILTSEIMEEPIEKK